MTIRNPSHFRKFCIFILITLSVPVCGGCQVLDMLQDLNNLSEGALYLVVEVVDSQISATMAGGRPISTTAEAHVVMASGPDEYLPAVDVNWSVDLPSAATISNSGVVTTVSPDPPYTTVEVTGYSSEYDMSDHVLVFVYP